MSTDRLDLSLERELDSLKAEGRAKAPERVIEQYIPARGPKGPRYKLAGSDTEFIRLNSNSYLSLSQHPDLVAAADKATREFGVGPGAIRFIDGTFVHHAALEKRVAAFVDKSAAKIFNSAYNANCGLGPVHFPCQNLLDRGSAQPQQHYPGHADQQYPQSKQGDLQTQ